MWPDNQITTDPVHLSDEQIRRMVRDPNHQGKLQGEEWQAANRHVASCDICQLRLEVLLHGGWSSEEAASGECPPHTIWYRIAAGTIPADQAQSSLTHAEKCAKCAQSLREASEDMRSDLLSEEEAAIQALSTSRPEWPREFTRRLLPEQTKTVATGGWFRWNWKVGAALAAAACAVLVAALFPRTSDEERVQKLLAGEYRADRFFEYRLPGADPAPIKVLLSQDHPPERNLDYFKARSTIESHLTNDKSSWMWLDLKGRSELLDKDYPDAISILESAKQLPGAGQQVWNDLVAAYGARATDPRTDEGLRNRDRQDAQRVNNEALARDHNDPIALFNKGIVEADLQQFDEAVASLNYFIQQYRGTGWAADAQRRLDELAPSQKKHSTKPALGPANYLRSPSDPEIFMEEAVRSWLPNSTSQDYRTALTQLADDMRSQHGDLWLLEVLHQPRDSEAFEALSAAVTENLRGDYHGAMQDAVRAEARFQRAGATAAAARAKFEKVYAEQRLLSGKNCSPDAEALLHSVRGRGFNYLTAQAYLESAACHSFLGDFGQANRNTDKAIALADQSKLRIVGLRALGIRASLDTTEGDPDRAWVLCMTGLREYWKSWAPPMRAYHFLTEMEFSAEDEGKWEVAKSLQVESIQKLEQDEDLDLQAIAHFRLARLAVATNDTETADREFRRAAELFRSAPDQKTARLHELESRVGLATLQLKRGSSSEAEDNLDRVQTMLSEADPYYLLVQYYAARGDLDSHQQHWSEAEAAYAKGIEIAETALRRLTDGDARLHWSATTEHSYRALAGIFISRGDTDAAWRIWQIHCSAALPSSHSAPKVRGPTGQARLRLTYLQLDKGLAIWSSSPSKNRFYYEALDQDSLARDSRRFLLLCSRPDPDPRDLHALARSLYKVVFGPELGEMAAVRLLLIQPDGVLSDLPLEALEDDTGHYVGEFHQISYSPGMGYDRESGIAGASALPAIALIGEAGILPGTGYELEQFRVAFPHLKVFEGRSVTPEILRNKLPSAGVFEFVGHGRESFTGSGLLLRSETAGNAELVLDSKLLNSLPLSHMKLAVLSACSTARGQRGLLDPRSLVQSFLRAGTHAVIASRWDVDSAATADLFASFYQNLAKGQEVPEALAMARNAVRTGRNAQPFYWAAFSVYE
ncbi:MAG TPA: CHAT domain-containing protein [Terriglobales bacterium]